MPAKAGDALPDVVLYENTPAGAVKLRELFAGKKGVIFAVPGAFTPGCSKTHLPGYVASFDKYTAAGAEVVVCVSVNDPFVMAAWGDAQGATGKIRMLADMHLELTKALDVVLDAEEKLGNKRSQRYSAVVKDNVITHFNLEEPGQMVCSLADPTLAQLQSI